MQINPKIAHTEIGESIILLSSGKDKSYHELNPTASRIWKLLGENKSETEICETLAEEFDQVDEELSKDVSDFINELRAKNIILD